MALKEQVKIDILAGKKPSHKDEIRQFLELAITGQLPVLNSPTVPSASVNDFDEGSSDLSDIQGLDFAKLFDGDVSTIGGYIVGTSPKGLTLVFNERKQVYGVQVVLWVHNGKSIPWSVDVSRADFDTDIGTDLQFFRQSYKHDAIMPSTATPGIAQLSTYFSSQETDAVKITFDVPVGVGASFPQPTQIREIRILTTDTPLDLSHPDLITADDIDFDKSSLTNFNTYDRIGNVFTPFLDNDVATDIKAISVPTPAVVGEVEIIFKRPQAIDAVGIVSLNGELDVPVIKTIGLDLSENTVYSSSGSNLDGVSQSIPCQVVRGVKVEIGPQVGTLKINYISIHKAQQTAGEPFDDVFSHDFNTGAMSESFPIAKSNRKINAIYMHFTAALPVGGETITITRESRDGSNYDTPIYTQTFGAVQDIVLLFSSDDSKFLEGDSITIDMTAVAFVGTGYFTIVRESG